jgi:hypothetical protein
MSLYLPTSIRVPDPMTSPSPAKEPQCKCGHAKSRHRGNHGRCKWIGLARECVQAGYNSRSDFSSDANKSEEQVSRELDELAEEMAAPAEPERGDNPQ